MSSTAPIELLELLSSRDPAERKAAISKASSSSCYSGSHLIRLSIQYVATHDPDEQVRALARLVVCRSGAPPDGLQVWDKTFVR